MSVTQELPGKGRKLRPLRFVSFIHCFAWKRSADSFTGCTVSCLLVWEHKQRACHFPHCMRRQCFVLRTRFTQVFLKLSWQFGRMLSIFGFPWPLIPFTYLLYSKGISKGSIRVKAKTKQTSDCTKQEHAHAPSHFPPVLSVSLLEASPVQCLSTSTLLRVQPCGVSDVHCVW